MGQAQTWIDLVERLGMPIAGFMGAMFVLYRVFMMTWAEKTSTFAQNHIEIKNHLRVLDDKINSVEREMGALSGKVDLLVDLRSGNRAD